MFKNLQNRTSNNNPVEADTRRPAIAVKIAGVSDDRAEQIEHSVSGALEQLGFNLTNTMESDSYAKYEYVQD